MRALIAALVLAGAAPARAEPSHTVYVEALGKAGPYGVGYELGVWRRVAVGAAASFAVIDGQQVLTVSPYVHAVVLARGAHAWFAELGPSLSRVTTPSPVPEWDGTSATGIGGILSSGYEWSGPVLFRASLSVVAGEGGVAPWLGVALGKRF